MTSPNQAEAQREEEPKRQIVRSQKDLVQKTTAEARVLALMTKEISKTIALEAEILSPALQDQEETLAKHLISKNHLTRETASLGKNLIDLLLQEATAVTATKTAEIEKIANLGRSLTDLFHQEAITVNVTKAHQKEETANLGKKEINLFLLEEQAVVAKKIQTAKEAM